jgi:hypothetical protein
MDFDGDAVLEIAARGEGREVEFKRGLPAPAKTARSLVAFANTRGGVLLIGLDDRGRVYGVPEPRAVAAALRACAAERADPPIRVHVQAVRIGERHVVACSVPLSPARPHALVQDGGKRELVVRVGSSNRVASGATLAALQRPHRRPPANALERRVLAWMLQRPKGQPGSAARFAKENNVGLQRARRAFVELERAGRLVAHGLGARREYELA